MLTGEIRNQVDQIWNAFWSGGVSNPLSVIEQITYLLFIKRLDDLHTLEENKAANLKIPMERRIFPEGNDDQGRPYSDLRWSRFKNFEARAMMDVVAERVLHEQRGVDARATGTERTVDAIFDDPEHEHGVDVFTTQNEIRCHRDGIAVVCRHAADAGDREVTHDFEVQE